MKFDYCQVRRDLHQIPEVDAKEFETTKYIQARLGEMGLESKSVLETGLVSFINVGSESTIAFRADIDALPIQEENEHDFVSKKPGFMHACGHDGHMTMLLGFADFLSRNREKIRKNILLIFQPSEESGGGAKKLVDKNVLSDYCVDMIFGTHLYPGLEEGVIGCKAGEFMARNCEINITVYGKSAHGAMPHLGIDSIVIASDLIQKFQTIITRELSPFHSNVITFGKITGGDARNIIAGKVRMEGTIRSYKVSDYNHILNSVKRICDAQSKMHQVEIDVEIVHGYPAVINDKTLLETLKDVVQDDYHEFEYPFMLSEDFSYYQEKVKGLFYFLGTRNEEEGLIEPLHSPKFNFNEDVLVKGIDTYINIAKKLGVIE